MYSFTANTYIRITWYLVALDKALFLRIRHFECHIKEKTKQYTEFFPVTKYIHQMS